MFQENCSSTYFLLVSIIKQFKTEAYITSQRTANLQNG